MVFAEFDVLLLGICVLGSIFMCFLFYLSMDPLKGRIYLVMSLILVSFILSYGVCVWYSYYICLVFLSGVFIIMVYFSRLASFKYFFVRAKFLCILLGVLVRCRVLSFGGSGLGLRVLYYDVYLYVIIYLVVSLLFFLNFVSYFLVWGVALRRMYSLSLWRIFCLRQKGL